MLKLGIVGCGAISKKHLTAILDNKEFYKLTAVCDLDQERATTLADQYNNTTGYDVMVFSNFHDLIETADIDVLTVSTSSSLHHQFTKLALQNNLHVILEKPMALSIGDGNEIIELSQKNDRKVSVCYISRFYPHFQRIKQIIEEGKIGRILHASMQVFWNRDDEYFLQAPWRGTWDKDGGMLMNQCTHGIDIMNWLIGSDPEIIHGVLRRYQRPIVAEDFAAGIVEYKNGSVGVIQGTVNAYPKNHDATLSIFAEKGTIVIGGNAINKVTTWNLPDEEDIPEFALESNGHSVLYRDFADAIENDHEPLINAEEGMKSIEIVLGIQKSMKEKASVHIPFSWDTESMKGLFE